MCDGVSRPDRKAANPNLLSRYQEGCTRMTVPATTSALTGGPDHLFPCVSAADLSFTEGAGAWLHGSDGGRYLDFATGIAVTGLGHSHPELVDALVRQATRLWHVSNTVRIPEQEELAGLLCEKTFADGVFFCNSGAEAIETAIKTARRH
jgi:acetylornithine/N-succinyldiaminopimelate aminotransferase